MCVGYSTTEERERSTVNIVSALSITGTVTFILGLGFGAAVVYCGICICKKKFTICYETNKSQHKSIPVYEDVDLKLKVQVSPNIAYEGVHKTFQSQPPDNQDNNT